MSAKPLLATAALWLATPAAAFDVDQMIAQCDAPMSRAIEVAAQRDVQSAEWSNLNTAVKLHRTACATPIALSCHLSDAPADCYAQTTAAFDAMAEQERLKIVAYAEDGGLMVGMMPQDAARTGEVRANARAEQCAQNTSDAAAYVGVLGGDKAAACALSMAVAQWADLAFTGSAPAAFSLLPPQ